MTYSALPRHGLTRRDVRLTCVLAALARLWAPSRAGRRGTCSRTAPFSTMRHGAAPRCPRHPLLPAQLWLCPNAVASASVEGPGRDLAAPDSEQAGRKVRAHAADAGAFQRLSQACVHSRRCVWHRGDTRPASATMAATTRRWSTTRSWDTQLPRSTTERSRLVRCKVGGSCSAPGSPHCSVFSACRPAAAHAQHAAQPTAGHAPAAGGAEVPNNARRCAPNKCVSLVAALLA